MQETPIALSTTRAIVLGDHQVLCEAIKTGLKHHFGIEFVELQLGEPGQQANHEVDNLTLIIIALLAPDSTPAEMLSRTSLLSRLGEIPLLIISEGHLEVGLEAKMVFSLAFPFTYDELYAKTAEILSHAPEHTGGGEVQW